MFSPAHNPGVAAQVTCGCGPAGKRGAWAPSRRLLAQSRSLCSRAPLHPCVTPAEPSSSSSALAPWLSTSGSPVLGGSARVEGQRRELTDSIAASLGTREQGRVPARGLVSVTLALLGCGHTPRAARMPTASAGTDLARQAWQASHGHAGCTTHPTPPHPPTPATPSPASTPCAPMGSWPRVAARRPSLWHPTKAFPGRGRHTDISRGGVGGGRPAGGSPR